MFTTTMILFAYFSPETYLPVTSVIASVVGFFLMFGKNSFRIIKGLIRREGSSKSEPATRLKGPHTAKSSRIRSKTPKA